MPPLRRFAVPVLALALASGLVLASCSDEGDSVLDQGGDLELTGGGTTCTSGDLLDIPEQICALFDKGTETSFLARYDNVKKKLGQGKQSVAVTQMLALINSVFDKADRAQDPDGPGGVTTDEALAELIEDLFAAIGFEVELDPALFDGGSITVIDESGGTAEDANGFEIVVVPENAVDGPTLIVITPIDDGSNPFPGFFSVPKYFDNTAFPLEEGGPALDIGVELAGDGPSEFEFNQPVTVALCAVTDDLTEEQADALQLAHDTGDGVEILDPVAVPPGLDCDDAVDETASFLRRPGAAGGGLAGEKRGPGSGAALHGGRGVGGQVSSFSEFGAVIPESETTIEGIVFTENDGEQPVEGADVELYCETPEPVGLRGAQLAEGSATASTTSNGDGFYSFSAGEDGFAVDDSCFLQAFSDGDPSLFGFVDSFDVETGENEKDIELFVD